MTPVDIDKLKELLVKVGWTRLHTDYLDQDYDPQREGWRIHDFPADSRGADLIVDGIEDEHEAALIVDAVNSLPALIAKAERVDALERVLLPLVDRLTESEASFTKADELMGGPITDADGVFVSIGELRAARNALSPKESE